MPIRADSPTYVPCGGNPQPPWQAVLRPAAAPLLALVLAACGNGSGPPAAAASPTPAPSPTAEPDILLEGWTRSELAITYAGNAGFLLESGDVKIAVDALFRFDTCRQGSDRHQHLATNAAPPFHDIDLILVTHEHADHFDSGMVGSYLAGHPNTIAASTPAVAAAIRGAFPDLQRAEERVVGLLPEYGVVERVSVGGIDVDLMWLPEDGMANLGFLLDLGGYTLFHTGDLSGESPTEALGVLQDHQIPARDIDIAFIGFYYMQIPAQRVLAREGVATELLIPMHFWCSIELNVAEIEANFPNAVVFREQLQRLTLQAVSGSS